MKTERSPSFAVQQKPTNEQFCSRLTANKIPPPPFLPYRRRPRVVKEGLRLLCNPICKEHRSIYRRITKAFLAKNTLRKESCSVTKRRQLVRGEKKNRTRNEFINRRLVYVVRRFKYGDN